MKKIAPYWRLESLVRAAFGGQKLGKTEEITAKELIWNEEANIMIYDWSPLFIT